MITSDCRLTSISINLYKLSMIINSIYKLLNATIGSNLEALFAGKTPKIKPIDPDIIMVEIVVVNPTDAGSGVMRDKRKTPDNPVVVPINPPIEDKINASIKN